MSFPLKVETSLCTLSFPLFTENGTISSWAVLWPTRSKISRSFTTTWPFKRTSKTWEEQTKGFKRQEKKEMMSWGNLWNGDLGGAWIIKHYHVQKSTKRDCIHCSYEQNSHLLLRLSKVNLSIFHDQYVVSFFSYGYFITESILVVSLCLVKNLILWAGAQDRQTETIVWCWKRGGVPKGEFKCIQ